MNSHNLAKLETNLVLANHIINMIYLVQYEEFCRLCKQATCDLPICPSKKSSSPRKSVFVNGPLFRFDFSTCKNHQWNKNKFFKNHFWLSIQLQELTFCVRFDCERLLNKKATLSCTSSGGSGHSRSLGVATSSVSILAVLAIEGWNRGKCNKKLTPCKLWATFWLALPWHLYQMWIEVVI